MNRFLYFIGATAMALLVIALIARDGCDHDKEGSIIQGFESASKQEVVRAKQGDFPMAMLLPRHYIMLHERNRKLNECGCTVEDPMLIGRFVFTKSTDPSCLFLLMDRYKQLRSYSVLNDKEGVELKEIERMLCAFTKEQDGVDACPEVTIGEPMDIFRVDHAIRAAMAQHELEH